MPAQKFAEAWWVAPLLIVLGSLAYGWYYLGWLEQGTNEAAQKPSPLPQLTEQGERTRWHIAAACALPVLAEVIYGKVRSPGIYFALLTAGLAYVIRPATTREGLELTPRQQTAHRRWAILPAGWWLLQYTDFKTAPVHAVILVAAATILLLVVLLPEPRE
jgi:hypothetical protein